MYSEDDMHFAFESTQVLHEPDRRIDTFGSTNFEFRLVTELLDAVDRVRVREGRISAEKPQILRPESMADFEFEGFGEQASVFADWLRQKLKDLRVDGGEQADQRLTPEALLVALAAGLPRP
jgi:hypothetical protein